MEKKASIAPHQGAQSTASHQDAFTTTFVENGVYFSRLQHAGQGYRLGATTPRFRHELTSLPMEPSTQDFEELAQKGLWLMPDATAPKVGITCGGVGSIWPGMGRALYDTFPAARAAMDRLAAVAPWDILGLMDETDMEKLQCTRWQMPYLFFVEYAQASYLQSLGFTPHIMSGHSLGELIGLCLAGVYSPEIAWQIFDRRAVYIDGLERNAEDGMGMMTVFAAQEKVFKLLEEFPDLYLSNHNTPSQCILGGKKERLTEAKRALRKEKCPALILPINMAFHHPHLRVLRQSAVDGLMGLPTHVPEVPVLSNVTAGLYPTDKESIVQYIADLDENTVRWVDCVRAMWDTFNIRHFVELGSADNISGLVKEIEPRAVCLPVSLKNAEVKTMRAAVAQLYALGHIPTNNLHVVPADAPELEQTPFNENLASVQGKYEATAQMVEATPARDVPIAAHVQDILPIIAAAAEVEQTILRPSMDFRHELALRSNRFPGILHAVEQKFGIQLRLEDVLHVATIQDFADVVARLRGQEVASHTQAASTVNTDSALTSQEQAASFTPPLICASLVARPGLVAEGGVSWRAVPWPVQPVPMAQEHRSLIILSSGESAAPFHALEELAPLGYTFVFIEGDTTKSVKMWNLPTLAQRQTLEALGAKCDVVQHISSLGSRQVQGIVHFCAADAFQMSGAVEEVSVAATAFSALVGSFRAQFMLVVTVDSAEMAPVTSVETISFDSTFEGVLGVWETFCHNNDVVWRTIRMPSIALHAANVHQGDSSQNTSYTVSPQEIAQYFARSVLCRGAAHVRWLRVEQGLSTLEEYPVRCPQIFPLAFDVEATQENERHAKVLFTAQRHFSVYGDSLLEVQRGAEHRAPKLSVGLMLQSLYEAVQMPFAWLFCCGVDALRVHSYVFNDVTMGPEGVTREGLIQVQSAAWTQGESSAGQDKSCLAELSLRTLSSNGRRLDRWESALEAHLLLAPTPCTPQLLWEENATPILYEEGLQGRKAFAMQHSLGYNWVILCVEMIEQAAQAEGLQEFELVVESVARIRHVSDGFVKELFRNTNISGVITWRIMPCEDDAHELDAQVFCDGGTLVLTIEKMRFVKK